MLSLAGASYQGVFRNPLVDPYLLGAAAGAGLGRDDRVHRRGAASTADWPVDPAPAVAFVVALVDRRSSPTSSARRSAAPRSGVTLVLAGVAWSSLADRDPDVHPAAQRRGRPRGLQRGSSAGCRRRRGPTCGWSLPYVVVSSRRAARSTAGTSTCSASATTRRRRSARRWRGSGSSSWSRRRSARPRSSSVSGLIGFVGIVVPHVVRLVAGVELPPAAAAVAACSAPRS